MRKIREVLRLKFDQGYGDQQIAQSCAMGRSTVGEYLQRFAQSGLSWPLPEALDDAQLEAELFPASAGGVGTRHPEPDWTYMLDTPEKMFNFGCRQQRLGGQFRGERIKFQPILERASQRHGRDAQRYARHTLRRALQR